MDAPGLIRQKRGAISRGIHLFSQWLILPRATDEDTARKEYILNIILAGSVAMLILLDASVLYYALLTGADYDGVPFSVFSIIPLFFILLQLLSRKGHTQISSYLLIGAYLISDSVAAYYWEVRLPEILMGYVLIILIASILINTRFGFLVTGLIALFVIPLGYAQHHHLLIPKGEIHTNGSGGIVFAVLLFLVMVIAWLSNREIEKSLARARRSEKELKAERDNLEITVAQRTQELSRTQFEKVEQICRFAEFGQLASGIFHDILNLLNVIALRAEDSHDDAYPLGEAFQTTKLIQRFMHAIRRQLDHHDARESFSLAESIDQAIQLVAYKANVSKVRIVFRHDHAINPSYFGNPFTFHQVVINTLINAIESYEGLPDDGARSRTIVIQLDRKQGTLHLRVEDHGAGIPQSAQDKIFEPFFSTKTGAQGSGIGLATVRKIVEEDLKGSITFSTVEGQGTIFLIAFPARMPPARKS